MHMQCCKFFLREEFIFYFSFKSISYCVWTLKIGSSTLGGIQDGSTNAKIFWFICSLGRMALPLLSPLVLVLWCTSSVKSDEINLDDVSGKILTVVRGLYGISLDIAYEQSPLRLRNILFLRLSYMLF